MRTRLDPQYYPQLMKRKRSRRGCQHANPSKSGWCGQPIHAFWLVKPTKEGQQHTKANIIGVCALHDELMQERRNNAI